MDTQILPCVQDLRIQEDTQILPCVQDQNNILKPETSRFSTSLLTPDNINKVRFGLSQGVPMAQISRTTGLSLYYIRKEKERFLMKNDQSDAY
jgi:hypothetical protein